MAFCNTTDIADTNSTSSEKMHYRCKGKHSCQAQGTSAKGLHWHRTTSRRRTKIFLSDLHLFTDRNTPAKGAIASLYLYAKTVCCNSLVDCMKYNMHHASYRDDDVTDTI